MKNTESAFDCGYWYISHDVIRFLATLDKYVKIFIEMPSIHVENFNKKTDFEISIKRSILKFQNRLLPHEHGKNRR